MNGETGLLWLTDADNTLWDTDSVYRVAQLALLGEVEKAVSSTGPQEKRLDFLRQIDQALAERDHRGLKYPASMLVSALSQVLLGISVEHAVTQALQGSLVLGRVMTDHILAKFYERLGEYPALRTGVRAGLEQLNHACVDVMVLTESKKDWVERVLQQTELNLLVTSVTAAEKSVALYARFSRLRPQTMTWMIGDQIDRDVLMASQAGLRTAYFPGGFRPSWARTSDALPEGCIEVADYREAVAQALRLKEEG